METTKLSKNIVERLFFITGGITVLTFFILELFNHTWIPVFQWNLYFGFDMSEGDIFFTTLKVFGITSGLSMIFIGFSSRSWITVIEEN